MEKVFASIESRSDALFQLNVSDIALDIIEEHSLLTAVIRRWDELEICAGDEYYGSVGVQKFFSYGFNISTAKMKKFAKALLTCAEMRDCEFLPKGTRKEQVRRITHTGLWTFVKKEGIPDIKEPEE